MKRGKLKSVYGSRSAKNSEEREFRNLGMLHLPNDCGSSSSTLNVLSGNRLYCGSGKGKKKYKKHSNDVFMIVAIIMLPGSERYTSPLQ